MSIAMSLSRVTATTSRQSASSDCEDAVTEVSFERSISYEKVGDRRASHFTKNWEQKEKRVNDACRSSASRAKHFGPHATSMVGRMPDVLKMQRQLTQQEKTNTGFDLLSAESKWTEIIEKEEKAPVVRAKVAGNDGDAVSWTLTAKKSIEYSRD